MGTQLNAHASVGVDEYVDPWREAPSAPPLGELSARTG